MSDTLKPIPCKMKAPNVHPDCEKAGRTFVSTKWNLDKRVYTCKPCCSLRNAAYRVKRAGGSEAEQEEARQRARSGQLSSPIAAGTRVSRAPGQEGGTPRRAARRKLELPEIIKTYETRGRDGNGKTRYLVTLVQPDRIEDFTNAETPASENYKCIICPDCGRRGEFRKPKWAAGMVRHIVAWYGNKPRLMDFCLISVNHAISDAMRDVKAGEMAARFAKSDAEVVE